ncbi:GAF domain-containing protein [Rhodococcus jostii]|uniref:histidine kinase n=1 Tax=Rhodococcus jostii TaxID=132919 RepID=A0A1H4IQN9_RHOJO|nr:GAF domain-containing protein [Rhodococcus jostii]SEB36431.1 Histidine kinase-, DNA gyrase B-, and HSP90-like ATPase [Rhodococcus jostii]
MSLLVHPTTPPLWLGIVVAASLIAVESLLVLLLEHLAPGNTFGAVFLLGVLVVSAGWGFGLSVATTLASALVYVYVHLETNGSVLPSEVEDWMAIVIFLPIAFLANVLAGQARLRTAEAEQRRREAEASRDQLGVLADQQAALRRVATRVARGASPSEVFSAVADELARCLNAATASVNSFDDGMATVVAVAAPAPGIMRAPRVGERHTLSEGDNIATRVYHTGRAARLDGSELQKAPDSVAARLREMGLRSTVAVPIIVDERVWGMAAVGSLRPEPLLADTEARTSDFADLVATAVANAATRAELLASRARIVAAGDQARRRLERDLHDGAQQRLVSLGLELRKAEASVPPPQNDLKEQLSHIVSGLTGVSEDLQQFSRGIHPAILSKGGLGSAIRTLARRSAVPVTLDIAVDRPLPESAEVAAYYVVSETLTNAAKHAQASEVHVSARAEDDTLDLMIQDDGVGGADSRKGSGLIGLIDRVEALGGHLEITSQPGNGTVLHVTIPVEPVRSRRPPP